jgi:hypothetical protein
MRQALGALVGIASMFIGGSAKFGRRVCRADPGRQRVASASYSPCAAALRYWPRHHERAAAMKNVTRACMTGAWLAALAATAIAQRVPEPPKHAASQTTAPTNATARTLDDGRANLESERPVGTAVDQIAVPLKRGEHKPTVLKPGKPGKSVNGVDDDAARCQAERTKTARDACLGFIKS